MAAEQPERVVVVADWLTFVSAGATVLAAILALFSIVYAARQAQQSREEAEKAAAAGRMEAAHDRRMQYELGILAEMSRQHGITGFQHLRGYVRALVGRDARDDDLPVLRVATDVYPTDHGRAKRDQAKVEWEAEASATGHQRSWDRYALEELVGREIEEAISRRLSES